EKSLGARPRYPPANPKDIPVRACQYIWSPRRGQTTITDSPGASTARNEPAPKNAGSGARALQPPAPTFGTTETTASSTRPHRPARAHRGPGSAAATDSATPPARAA